MSEHRAVPHAPALTPGWGGLCVLAFGMYRERKIRTEGKKHKTFSASKFSDQTKTAQDAYLLHHSLLGFSRFHTTTRLNHYRPGAHCLLSVCPPAKLSVTSAEGFGNIYSVTIERQAFLIFVKGIQYHACFSFQSSFQSILMQEKSA